VLPTARLRELDRSKVYWAAAVSPPAPDNVGTRTWTTRPSSLTCRALDGLGPARVAHRRLSRRGQGRVAVLLRDPAGTCWRAPTTPRDRPAIGADDTRLEFRATRRYGETRTYAAGSGRASTSLGPAGWSGQPFGLAAAGGAAGAVGLRSSARWRAQSPSGGRNTARRRGSVASASFCRRLRGRPSSKTGHSGPWDSGVGPAPRRFVRGQRWPTFPEDRVSI